MAKTKRHGGRRLSIRIRGVYFDQIVRGDKTVELRKTSPYWLSRANRLLASKARLWVAVFVCGPHVHRREIIAIKFGKASEFLKRELSEQGKRDLGGDDPEVVAFFLGDEIGA